MKYKIDKTITCPYCENQNKVTISTYEEFKDLINCEECGRLFTVSFNRGEYEPPICANSCEEGFVFVDARKLSIQTDGWKAETRKVLKSGKLSKKIHGYKEYKFNGDDCIECLGCGDKWEGIFDEKGRVV